MHVLIIPSWYPHFAGDIGGSFFREQALALQKNGCKVGVIYPQLRSLRNWKSIFARQRKITVEDDSGVQTYRSHGMNWFPRILKYAAKLYLWHGKQLYDHYVTDNGLPDVIHVHSLLNAGLLAELINEEYGIPFVVTEHSTGFERKVFNEQQLCAARRTSSLAKRRFAVSNEFANLLNKSIGSENSKWEVLSNIVSDIFTKHLLESYKKDRQFKFINVALMDEKKSQKNIIKAFSVLKKMRKDITLEMVGDGPERKNLEKLSIELGIQESVKFSGLLSREDVVKSMAKSDAFVLSSRYETFGVVLIEALALGKPVISTRCGGPESIVREKDGILVPIEDVIALGSAMDLVIKNYDKYDAIEIRQSCIERYGEVSISKKLMRVYSEILQLAPR